MKIRGIVIGILGFILAMFQLVSNATSITVLIIGFAIFLFGAVLAGHDYLAYQKSLILQQKQKRAAKKAQIELEQRLNRRMEAEKAREVEPEQQLNKVIEAEPEQQINKRTEAEEVLRTEYEQLLNKRNRSIQQHNELFEKALQSIPVNEIVVGEKVNRNKVILYPDIHFKNITRSTNISKLFPLVVVDIETTGLKATDDIIEVAAIKFSEGFKAESCISMLCKPRKPIPEEATMVNGITDDMVKDCPSFSQIAESVAQYISGCTIVGHNLEFDLKRLFVSGVALTENVSCYDTLKLCRYVLKAESRQKYNYKTEQYEDAGDYDVTDYKLDTVCEYYGIYRNEAHRALSDCLATAMLFEHLIEEKTA